MKLTRRNFLAWAGIAATGAIACDLFDDELRVQSPAAIPEDLVSGRDNWYATYDASVPGGQGLLVRVMEGRAKKVRGNPRFPTNQGKQSPAADAILQSLYHPDRIAGPMLRTGPRGAGSFRPISWDEALNRFNAVLNARGDGMLLITEPRNAGYARIADAFADAFGGRRLAFAAVDDAAYRSAVSDILGGSRLPYYDIANADTLISFGSDFLSTWGSPVAFAAGYGKFRSGDYTGHRGSHYHFDARYSLTAANADKWLPIAPGSEGYAALALAWAMLQAGSAGGDIDAMTNGQGAAALNDFRPDAVAGALQIPDAALGGKTLAEFFEELAREKLGRHSLALGGGDAAGAYSNGKFNAAAVLALNFVMDSVGRPGGLLLNPDNNPRGLSADAAPATLNDWRRAVSDINSGATRLVIAHNADPVYGLPAGVGMGDALRNENAATVISASSFIDETSVMADLIIPDRAALEEWGDHIPEPGPGYAVYAIQQPVVNPLSDLDPRSFADIMIAAANDLGRGSAMPADSYEALIRSSVESVGADFTDTLKNGGWWDESGSPYVPAPAGLLNDVAALAAPANAVGAGDFQLLPYQHHTILDGRQAHLPWAQSAPDPLTTVTWQTWVDINERQGRELGLREGDVVNISTDAGSISALVYLNPGTPPGIAAVPMGGGRRAGSEYATGREARESGNVLSILAVAEVDGVGGLAWGGNRCSVTPAGGSMAVSKLEGDYANREIGEHSVEQVFKTAGGGH